MFDKLGVDEVSVHFPESREQDSEQLVDPLVGGDGAFVDSYS